MSLEKQVIIDLIETIQDGSVQVRTKTVIVEDGNQISESFHRHIVAPGDDYSQEDARVPLTPPRPPGFEQPHTPTQ